MHITRLSAINFNAKLISRPEIMKYKDDTKSYDKVPVSFVELDPVNKNDLKSLNEAVNNWQYDLYGMNIAYAFERASDLYDPDASDKFYAITTQNKNLEKLYPDKIEAVAHVYETNNRVEVFHLQVNPDLVYSIDTPEYKYVGKGMIDSLKEKYNNKSITLIASSSATKFYEKQGFERTNDPENRLTWNKEAEDNVKYKDEYW